MLCLYANDVFQNIFKVILCVCSRIDFVEIELKNNNNHGILNVIFLYYPSSSYCGQRYTFQLFFHILR